MSKSVKENRFNVIKKTLATKFEFDSSKEHLYSKEDKSITLSVSLGILVLKHLIENWGLLLYCNLLSVTSAS